jgi:hypothetical protein
MTDRFLLAMLAGMLGITLTIAIYFIYIGSEFESCNGNLVCEDE